MFAMYWYLGLATTQALGFGLAVWCEMLSSRPVPQPQRAVTYVREGNVIRVNFNR